MSVGNWPVEVVPDEDRLFMRVHKNNIRDGEPLPGAFKDHGGGMSTDWEKYSTPAETRERGAQAAANYGIISLPVGDTRNIPGLSVVHTPLNDNRAHTDVFGQKDTQARVMLGRICRWQIHCAT